MFGSGETERQEEYWATRAGTHCESQWSVSGLHRSVTKSPVSSPVSTLQVPAGQDDYDQAIPQRALRHPTTQNQKLESNAQRVKRKDLKFNCFNSALENRA